jgi:hypothetical protein
MKKRDRVKTPLIGAFRPGPARLDRRPGNRSIVASRHATKDEFARLFAAADAQLSTLRNPAR